MELHDRLPTYDEGKTSKILKQFYVNIHLWFLFITILYHYGLNALSKYPITKKGEIPKRQRYMSMQITCLECDAYFFLVITTLKCVMYHCICKGIVYNILLD